MSNEIDLHGFPMVEAIETFVNYYNDRVHNGDFTRILVIHGYGSTGEGGKIRVRLRNFLAGHRDFLAFECGEHIDGGNLGNTFVFPGKPLPSPMDALSKEILEYCRSPKTKSRIAGKFHLSGEAKIQACLQSLEKKKLLGVTYKGSHKLYQTV